MMNVMANPPGVKRPEHPAESEVTDQVVDPGTVVKGTVARVMPNDEEPCQGAPQKR